MVRATEEIAKEIAQFQPRDGSWLPLDELANELWKSGQPHKAISQLLRVFERFPEEDGAGVFWAILHGLESIEGYEPFLLQSLYSAPSKFGVVLLGRLLNSGTKEIEGKSIAHVLAELISSPTVSPPIQSQATRFLERHTK